MMERLKDFLTGHPPEDGMHKERSTEERELRVEMAIAAVDAMMVCAEQLAQRVEQVQRTRDSD
jgi:hypothetical protein